MRKGGGEGDWGEGGTRGWEMGWCGSGSERGCFEYILNFFHEKQKEIVVGVRQRGCLSSLPDAVGPLLSRKHGLSPLPHRGLPPPAPPLLPRNLATQPPESFCDSPAAAEIFLAEQKPFFIAVGKSEAAAEPNETGSGPEAEPVM